MNLAQLKKVQNLLKKIIPKTGKNDFLNANSVEFDYDFVYMTNLYGTSIRMKIEDGDFSVRMKHEDLKRIAEYVPLVGTKPKDVEISINDTERVLEVYYDEYKLAITKRLDEFSAKKAFNVNTVLSKDLFVRLDSEMLEDIYRADKFASDDKLRPEISSIALQTDGGFLTIITATDGHRLYRRKYDKKEGRKSVLLFPRLAVKLLKTIKPTSAKIYYDGGSRCTMVIEGVKINLEAVSGKYPDIDNLLGGVEKEFQFTIHTRDAVTAFSEITRLFCNVRMTRKDNRIVLRANHHEKNLGIETYIIATNAVLSDFDMGINGDYARDLFKACSHWDLADVFFKDATKAIYVAEHVGAGESKRLEIIDMPEIALQMPIRLSGEDQWHEFTRED